jgi:dTDP-glucose pyrophosphorylase
MSSEPLTIVVPMAGRGSRFADAGYADPKPLIPVNGKPMIKLVIENLRPRGPHRFVFICQRDHVKAYDLEPKLKAWAPGCEIVQLDGVTEGAACTVLTAAHLIGDGPLMIANSDQYIDHPIDAYLAAMEGLDGLIMTMQAHEEKWSFVAVDDEGIATEVAEKKPISTHATTGIYNFARGSDFIAGAQAMIDRDLRVNGEFYVAPVYNMLIGKGARFGISDIGEGMHGLGTPADLELFLAQPVAARVTA